MPEVCESQRSTAEEHRVDDEQRETLLVIVGAGASFDCLGSDVSDDQVLHVPGLPALSAAQCRPPLAAQLADPSPLGNRTLGKWDKARPVVDSLRREMLHADNDDARAPTLEQALRVYQDRSKEIPKHELHLLTFRFYLQDLLWRATSYMMCDELAGGVTNYLSLLSECMRWVSKGDRCVVFVSFNYDLLLERALESYGILNAGSIDSYVEDDTVTLLKPHGSIQWGWKVGPNQEHIAYTVDPYRHGAESVKQALHYGVDDSSLDVFYYAPHERDVDVALRTSNPMVPALALPIEGKSELIWPQSQSERLSSLEGGRVTRLLTVGWRGAEGHFLDRLKPVISPSAKALVVAKDRVESEEVASHLEKETNLKYSNSRPHWMHFGGSGFRELLDNPGHLRHLLK